MFNKKPDGPLKGDVLLSEQGLTPAPADEYAPVFNCPFWESWRRLGLVGDTITGKELRAVMRSAGFGWGIANTLAEGVEFQYTRGNDETPVAFADLRTFFVQHVGGIAHVAGQYTPDEGLRELMRSYASEAADGRKILTKDDWTRLRNERFETDDADVRDKSISWSEGALFWSFLGTEIDGDEVVLLEVAEAFFFDHLLPDDVLIPLRKIGLGEMVSRTAKLGSRSELAELKSLWD